MELSLTAEQQELRESVIKFARQELNDGVVEDDRAGRFPEEKWRKCAEMMILGLPFPEEYGGGGSDFPSAVVVLEALGHACTDGGLVHAVATQVICGIMIDLYGSDVQKERYLPGICSGDIVMSQAITEPGSGSDAMAMRTRAAKEGDGYVVNGTKTFITNGPITDTVILFAVTDPEKQALGKATVFVVEKGTPGFERTGPTEKMGLRTLQNGELVFTDCHVEESSLLGREGQGAMIFGDAMEWERILLPAVHLGTLARVMETSVAYAREREAFGQPIGKHQGVSFPIADMKVALEMGRLMLYRTASLKESGKRAAMETSILKLFVSEQLKQACLNAVQIHGGYGFSTEYHVERDLRDSVAATIYSGTSEMQRSMIARLMGL
jgi:alkylation response protein AidB-like acyl-CoA dehydrogenase